MGSLLDKKKANFCTHVILNKKSFYKTVSLLFERTFNVLLTKHSFTNVFPVPGNKSINDFYLKFKRLAAYCFLMLIY